MSGLAVSRPRVILGWQRPNAQVAKQLPRTVDAQLALLAENILKGVCWYNEVLAHIDKLLCAVQAWCWYIMDTTSEMLAYLLQLRAKVADMEQQNRNSVSDSDEEDGLQAMTTG
jgi:hypothetical protein